MALRRTYPKQPKRGRGPKPDRRRALELLASSRDLHRKHPARSRLHCHTDGRPGPRGARNRTQPARNCRQTRGRNLAPKDYRGRPSGAHRAQAMTPGIGLLLKGASASRPSGEWNEDDYDVLANGAVVEIG